MEYAQGRLFKDPSLPGMTVEERKVWIPKFKYSSTSIKRPPSGLQKVAA